MSWATPFFFFVWLGAWQLGCCLSLSTFSASSSSLLLLFAPSLSREYLDPAPSVVGGGGVHRVSTQSAQQPRCRRIESYAHTSSTTTAWPTVFSPRGGGPPWWRCKDHGDTAVGASGAKLRNTDRHPCRCWRNPGMVLDGVLQGDERVPSWQR